MSRDGSPYFHNEKRHSGMDGPGGNDHLAHMGFNSRQRPTSQTFRTPSPVNRSYSPRAQIPGYNRNSTESYNTSVRQNITGNNSSSNKYFSDSPQRVPPVNTKASFGGSPQHNSSTNYISKQETPGRQQQQTFPTRNLGTSSPSQTSPSRSYLQRNNLEDNQLRFSPPPGAAARQLPTHSVPTKLLHSPNQSRPTQSPTGGYTSSMPALGAQQSFYNRGSTLQPPLPSKPPTPPPPLPKEAPPPELDSVQRNFARYQERMPYLPSNNAAMMPVYRGPPPPILHPHLPPQSNYFLNPGPPRMFSPRPNFYNTPSPYQAGVYGHLGSRYINYKRKQTDGDIEMRKNNKKRKKPLSQNIPQRKDWSVEEAQKALEVEQECNKRARRQSLIIKFPDLELDRDIVSRLHSAIENVHFQQPSTARFCFVTLKGSADPETVIKELKRTKFGQGYLAAEVKKDREDDLAIGPEDIDPMTLYVGNLAQDVTKEAMMRTFPNNRRIDIGYAKKMKYTRYAFVSFATVDLAIEAFKKTHNTQMHSKSLIVRFRRLHGTVGMPGEPKPHVTRSDATSRTSNPSESEAEPQMGPWDTVDVSGWLPDSVKTERSDYTDDEYDYYYDDHDKMDEQYYVPDRYHNYDYPEDVKPSLPILTQPAQKDDVIKNSPVSQDSSSYDQTKTEKNIDKQKETDEIYSTNGGEKIEYKIKINDLVPKPFIAKFEESHERNENEHEMMHSCNQAKDSKEIEASSDVKEDKSIVESTENEPNMALHKPFIELVKREVGNQQKDDEERVKSSTQAETFKKDESDLVPKPMLEKKPQIDLATSTLITGKAGEALPKGNQSDKKNESDVVPKPIVECKPDLDFLRGTSSSTLHKLNKENVKTNQLLEEISDAINTLCETEKNPDKNEELASGVPRPFIILPEVKQEPATQGQNVEVRKDEMLNSIDPPRPILLPKTEIPESPDETANRVSDTVSSSLSVRDLTAKSITSVKKESPNKINEPSSTLNERIAKDSSPCPIPITEDLNRSNGNSSVPRPFEEKPNLKYEITDELDIEDTKKSMIDKSDLLKEASTK